MKVNNEARSHMVFLIEEIHRLKDYKEETFYSDARAFMLTTIL